MRNPIVEGEDDLRTVFILVDALRSDYLTFEHMPFLYSMAQEGIYVKRVIPSFSYCERTEIFTGMKPNVSGNFTAIGYDPNMSEYKYFKALFMLFGWLEKFDKKNILRRGMQRLLYKSSIKMKLYNIPFADISKFRLTEDYYSHYEEGAFVRESFFDIAKKHDIMVIKDAFTALGEKTRFSSYEEAVDFVCRQKNKDFDCLLFYIPNIDSSGHLHTSNAAVMNEELRKVDELVKKICTLFLEEKPTQFLILGDHGMEPVIDQIDVLHEIEKTNLKHGKDYDVFLDSTVARFWLKSERGAHELKQLLSAPKFTEKGFCLNEKLAEELNIPYTKENESGERLYGDIIWVANNGVLISPDYFNKGKSIRGMHSYSQKTIMSSGLAVVMTKEIPHKIIEECELIDICPTLCDLTGIPYPNGNEGISLFNR